jgi:hypothetical protein
MTDIIIVIEQKRASATNWIAPSPRTGNNEQQYRVYFGGEEIGSWRLPEHEAARWLLEHGKAERSDLLRTRRLIDGEQIASMMGSVGWFADRTVAEGEAPPRWAKHVPMSEGAKAAARLSTGTPSDDEPVQ